MFDIGPTELLLIVVVAIIVIGPKDLPLALRTAGRWIGRIRKVSGQFRAGFDAMVREAEMQELEEKWKAQNEKIMREHPNGGPPGTEQTGAYPAAPQPPPEPAASAEAKAPPPDNPQESADAPASGGKPAE
jgi:sec-independent protein translocase protein TatB